jgi:hypothetical protein
MRFFIIPPFCPEPIALERNSEERKERPSAHIEDAPTTAVSVKGDNPGLGGIVHSACYP